jgi:uncharacterized membrane protein
MDLYSLFSAIESSAVGEWVRGSAVVLPTVNVLHIIAVAIVFGTIFVVDLRLLGLPNTSRAFSLVARDGLRWTWAGFALAVLSGLLMLSANATTFYVNTQFWLKMGAIALAGCNMIAFEFLTIKTLHEWDKDAPTPRLAKLAGILSLLLWATAIVLGRWIGYTKGGFDMGDITIDLDNLDFLI